MVKRLNIFTLKIEQDRMLILAASNQYHAVSLSRGIRQGKKNPDINGFMKT